MTAMSTDDSIPAQNDTVNTTSALSFSRLPLYMIARVLPPKVNMAMRMFLRKDIEYVRLMADSSKVPSI